MNRLPHICVLLSLFFLQPVFAAESLKITLVEDPWPPYIEGEVGLPPEGGTLIKLCEEIFRQIDGVEVEFLLLPWKRVLYEVKLGKRDGIIALFKTPEREEVMEFTSPLFTGKTLLWYPTNKFPEAINWSGMEDLLPYRIVMLRGSAMGAPLLEARKQGVPLTIEKVNTHLHQFELLTKGKADLSPLTEVVGYHLIKKHGWEGSIAPMEKPLSSDDIYYMAFSKKSPARKLIPKINRVIEKMRKENLVNEILNGEHQAALQE